jgi:acyl carrier protein phosphodiesterase
MTDFLRKKEEANYTGRVLQGIQLHRVIDTFTDQHSASLELRASLRKRHGKYASVVVDLIWDYFLSKNWSEYSDEPLPTFNERMYEILLRRQAELPSRLQSRIERMVKGDFLMSYANKANMQRSLEWMDNRVNFPSSFQEATLDLEENESYFEQLFSRFFPELVDHTLISSKF